MHKLLRKPAVWLVAALVAVAAVAVWFASPEWTRSGNQMVVLSGNTPAALTSAQFVGRSNPADKIQVIIGLNIQNEKDLDDLLTRQADPNSPDFRKWITPTDFQNQFSPSQKDVDDVVAYLQSQGLTVLSVSDNRLLIHVEGTIEDFEKAFNVKINKYKLNQENHFSNDRDPSVPARMKDVVRSVSGMNTFAVYHAKHKGTVRSRTATPAGLSPQDVATAYSFPNKNNQSRSVRPQFSGKGVTIAIATAEGYKPGDVQYFWNQWGIKRTGSIKDIPINGTTTNTNGETTLDLQQVGAQAPGADILMYIGKDARFTTFSLVFNQIVTDNKASVVSISWGLCEDNTGAAQMYTEHVIFKQGNAQGIAFFAASGDDGAYDCSPRGTTLAVDYPSSDPHVSAVGGTSLIVDQNSARSSESAWTGAGGGISHFYKRPSWNNGKGIDPAGDMRMSADVALVSDPNTGYAMYYDGYWEVSGGTSFAAPNWAALWGLAQEGYGSNRLGPANPTLYRLASTPEYANTFFDITTGNNGDHRGPGYNSGADWDHPTGWGVPVGTKLADWLSKDKPGRRP